MKVHNWNFAIKREKDKLFFLEGQSPVRRAYGGRLGAILSIFGIAVKVKDVNDSIFFVSKSNFKKWLETQYVPVEQSKFKSFEDLFNVVSSSFKKSDDPEDEDSSIIIDETPVVPVKKARKAISPMGLNRLDELETYLKKFTSVHENTSKKLINHWKKEVEDAIEMIAADEFYSAEACLAIMRLIRKYNSFMSGTFHEFLIKKVFTSYEVESQDIVERMIPILRRKYQRNGLEISDVLVTGPSLTDVVKDFKEKPNLKMKFLVLSFSESKDGHYGLLYLDKSQSGNVRALVVDSTASKNYLSEYRVVLFGNDSKKINEYVDEAFTFKVRRQADPFSCSYYMLNDLVEILEAPQIIDQFSKDEKLKCSSDEEELMPLRKIDDMPSIFLRMAQSAKTMDDLVSKNPKLMFEKRRLVAKHERMNAEEFKRKFVLYDPNAGKKINTFITAARIEICYQLLKNKCDERG